MKWTHAALALGLLCVSALILGAAEQGAPEQAVAQPSAVDSIRSAHAFHAGNDIDCTDCHSAAAASTIGTDSLLPSMEDCAGCHDVEDEALCGTCHTNSKDPQSYPQRPAGLVQKFSHAAHAADMECTECHDGGSGKEPHAAAKSTCRNCHTTAADFVDCVQCHADSEPRLPMNHTAEWASTHGVEAGWDDVSCMNCHTQVDCQDCHSGDNVRPRVHATDFAYDHALAARSNELQCATCHVESQFCSDCHASMQVLPQDHSRADWLAGADGGRHATEGRLDLESCAACHDSGVVEPSCAECHGG